MDVCPATTTLAERLNCPLKSSIGLPPRTTSREALDRKRARLSALAEQRAEKRELLLHLRVLVLQIERLLRQRGLRPARHVEIALQLGRSGAQLRVFLRRGGGLGFQFLLALLDRAAIEAAEKLAEVESPPPHASGDQQQRDERRRLPAPRQMRAYGHPRSADPEGLPHAAADGAHRRWHQGRTGGSIKPVVSGSPNMRFMF
jgi:hypothetical protein